MNLFHISLQAFGITRRFPRVTVYRVDSCFCNIDRILCEFCFWLPTRSIIIWKVNKFDGHRFCFKSLKLLNHRTRSRELRCRFRNKLISRIFYCLWFFGSGWLNHNPAIWSCYRSPLAFGLIYRMIQDY